MPIDKGTTLPITQVTGLQINYKDENSCLNPPIVTTEERNKLVNSNDPKKPIKDGTIVFNSDTNVMEFYQGSTDTWKSAVKGNGDVVGPEKSINDRIAVFNGIDGKKINDGGITIAALQAVNSKDKAINATPLYKMSNLGALQFGSNDNVADTGVILVDGLIPVMFQTQGTGVDAQVCTIINGELGAGSSSPSALLEINSTSGGFLLSRLTTDQINALVSPKDGMVVYDTTLKQTRFRQNGQWVSGNIDNLTLKVTPVTTNYYQPTKDDCIIDVDVTGVTGTTTIDLFSPNNVALGIVYIIKDKTGQASTKNIKVSTVAGFRIDKDYDYIINTDYGWVEVFNNGQNWGIISESVSGGISNKTKKSLIYNKDNPPPKQINLISDLFPNTNSIKLTIISSGGNGGKGVGTNNGAGGGGGAVLVAYLNNIHSTNAKYIWISPKDSNLIVYNTWVAMNSSDSYQGNMTDFQCEGYVANMNGSDGNSSVNIGGLGASPQVLLGNDYPQSNFTWYGFKGNNGQGCSPNTSYSGSGGSSAVGQGAYGIGFNSNGLDSIIGYGGGGSGGNGDGKLGGSGGGYGTIIFEWEE